MTATTMMHEYRATRNDDGSLTIHDVPIFVECFRKVNARNERDEPFDGRFDAKWIDAAVRDAKQAARDGHHPPLHVRHHDKMKENDGVQPAGHYRVRGTKPISFKGEMRIAIMADLVITNPGVEFDIIAKRLPYRSVEIPDVFKPKISSLALLDHEAPFLELPMLMVSEIEGDDQTQPNGAPATFENPWRSETRESVLAFQAGKSVCLFFKDQTAMGNETDTELDEKTGTKMQDGDEEKSDDDKSTEMENGEGFDIKALVKAIKSKTISLGDMDMLETAIAEARSSMGSPDEDETPAPAAAPGAESMSETTDGANSAKMAALEGEVKALKLQGAQRDAKDQRTGDVADAMKRLEGRPVGDLVKFESELVDYHKQHGAAAFKAHVNAMVTTFGALPDDDDTTTSNTSTSKNSSSVAMSYHGNGTEAVEQATHFSAEWAQLSERGMTTLSEKDYVRNNMERRGVVLSEQE